ncbi:MAG: cation diffusion facilitator family transporter [Desulfomonilaceae bacterium]
MHSHDHSKEHLSDSQNRIAIAFFVTILFMVAEVIGGIVFNSLALLADAGHMISDIMALALSWVAIKIGKRVPTDRHTFGFKRSEILAAWLNGLVLWLIVALIFFEAGHRLFNPEPVQGMGMLVVAGLGLGVNLLMAWLLFENRRENLNMKAAFIHVISDAFGSVGAILGAVIILGTGLFWVDPLISIFIGLLILYSSWGLIKESTHILMEAVPAGLEISEIERTVLQHDNVCCVYDLHVWSIAGERPALSAHVVLAETDHVDRNQVLMDLSNTLRSKFNIEHSTIQIETGHEMRPDAECLSCRPGTSCATFH